MIQKDKTYNLATFFCLYIAQTIPMSFFSTVIPVMMRQENFSLSAIGLLQLIKLPWILKFLWSPMVDRHARTTGDYKRWIFSSELIYAVLIFAVAFLDFKTDFYRWIVRNGNRIICNIDHWNDFRTSRNDHRRRYRKYDRYGCIDC